MFVDKVSRPGRPLTSACTCGSGERNGPNLQQPSEDLILWLEHCAMG